MWLQSSPVLFNIIIVSAPAILLLQVLWPYCLEYLVPEQYTDAMCSICKAVTHVAKRLREQASDDFIVDFDKHGKFELLKGSF